MKRILLISNKVFHYRESIYNYFFQRFLEDGYEFHVVSDKYQNVYDHAFVDHKIDSLRDWSSVYEEVLPDFVIMFLHLKDGVMGRIISRCHADHVPVIYWNHGVNNADPNNVFKNAIFHRIHSRCDALITYTEKTRAAYFKPKNQKKLFVANNTLNFSDVDKNSFDGEAIKRKYGIREEIVVLFMARIDPKRRLDLLIDGLGGNETAALVIAGPGLPDKLQSKVDRFDNCYYFGPRYSREAHELYSIADIFSTPGHIGLAVNQALFWGVPVFILEHGAHAPEIAYLHNGINSYIAKNEEDLIREIKLTIATPDRLRELSDGASKTYDEEIDIENMYQGFAKAICYCEEGRDA